MEQKKNTALLVIDMQPAILANLPSAEVVVSKIEEAISFARSKNIPVMYVIVGFRNGAPEVSLNNKSFGAGKERFSQANMDDFLKIEPKLAPMPGEVIATKRRVSVFAGSDIEIVMRAQGVHHMVLTGVATSGAILSTVREAADKDYKITVLSDGCADGDEEVHRVLTTKIFPRQADVMTVEEWKTK